MKMEDVKNNLDILVNQFKAAVTYVINNYDGDFDSSEVEKEKKAFANNLAASISDLEFFLFKAEKARLDEENNINEYKYEEQVRSDYYHAQRV